MKSGKKERLKPFRLSYLGSFVCLCRALFPYCHLPQMQYHPEAQATVCVAKEWYRFPSSFFLPPNTELLFLRSGFEGQLPQVEEVPEPT